MSSLESRTSAFRFNLRKESEEKKSTAFNLDQAGPQLPIERQDVAIAQFDQSVDELPLPPNAQEVLTTLLSNALLLIDNGDHKSAIKILRNILARDPYYIDAIEWLGYCFTQVGDLQNAVKCFQEMSSLQPDEFSYTALADALYNIGHEQDAEIHYKLALGMIDYESPLLFNIHKNLGNIYVKAGDFDSAEENYNKAYILCPHSDALFVNFGTLELQRGDLETAHERFRSAVDLNAQNDKAWVGIALIHRSKGDFELAWANLERALDLNPQNKIALRIFVGWSFEDHQIDKAIERLDAYLDQATDDVDASLMLVEAFYRKGDTSKSRLELTRASSLAPDRPEIEKFYKILETEA